MAVYETGRPTDADRVDWREQLFNGGECGPAYAVALPAEAVTSLRAVFYDIDPGLFRPDAAPAKVSADPAAFYESVVRPWLDRHPALRGAEVRVSGGGLHAIVRFIEPVAFATDAERKRWSGVVKAVQAVLPSDPDAPGITALTRPVGSVNGKNGAAVRLLEAGSPVAAAEVLDLYGELRARPFRVVAGILFGDGPVSPCPVCRRAGSTLKPLDRVGACYGGCGKVPLARLYDSFLAPRPGRAAGTPGGEGGTRGGE